MRDHSVMGLLVLGVIGLTAMPVRARAEEYVPLQIKMDMNSLEVRGADETVLLYRYHDVPFKPYVKELRTPSGVNVLLDAPEDHLHHHGLMFACAVNNVDFWGEAVGGEDGHFEPGPGRQRHERFDGVNLSPPWLPPWAKFEEVSGWRHVDDPLLTEQRAISVTCRPNVTVLVWESTLSVPEGKDSVVLSGSHYHGLGMRFIRSMDATGEFWNADNDPGTVFRGEERLARSRWCAYTAPADGRTVTVVMFDHPANPRPVTWFMMAKPFAYMSATLRLHEESLKLLSGKPVTLRYAVLVLDERPDRSWIEKVYAAFPEEKGWRRP